eukprot:2111847-Prymnesium_polylepis.1
MHARLMHASPGHQLVSLQVHALMPAVHLAAIQLGESLPGRLAELSDDGLRSPAAAALLTSSRVRP